MEGQPWQWTEQAWRSQVARIRAGRSLAPVAWPHDARVAVALSFDSDHETAALGSGEVGSGRLAQGEYGARVGSRRILQLLDKWAIPATFFTPAVSALLHPHEVREYATAGHEVALHGWIHERGTLLPDGMERELAFRAADALEQVSGVRPVGMRTPFWDFSASTLPVIRELRLIYDSSLMGDDDPYELLDNGRETGIVELPVEWIRDDAPYLAMDPSGTRRPYTPPRELLTIWKDEFDLAYEEGGLFQVTCHPHIIGHRSRIGVLAQLAEYIAGHGSVWFATHAQVAEYVWAQASATRRPASGGSA
jgi:peptidoglycan-N-acetylglucosamine deacetylase